MSTRLGEWASSTESDHCFPSEVITQQPCSFYNGNFSSSIWGTPPAPPLWRDSPPSSYSSYSSAHDNAAGLSSFAQHNMGPGTSCKNEPATEQGKRDANWTGIGFHTGKQALASSPFTFGLPTSCSAQSSSYACHDSLHSGPSFSQSNSAAKIADASKCGRTVIGSSMMPGETSNECFGKGRASSLEELSKGWTAMLQAQAGLSGSLDGSVGSLAGDPAAANDSQQPLQHADCNNVADADIPRTLVHDRQSAQQSGAGPDLAQFHPTQFRNDEKDDLGTFVFGSSASGMIFNVGFSQQKGLNSPTLGSRPTSSLASIKGRKHNNSIKRRGAAGLTSRTSQPGAFKCDMDSSSSSSSFLKFTMGVSDANCSRFSKPCYQATFNAKSKSQHAQDIAIKLSASHASSLREENSHKDCFSAAASRNGMRYSNSFDRKSERRETSSQEAFWEELSKTSSQTERISEEPKLTEYNLNSAGKLSVEDARERTAKTGRLGEEMKRQKENQEPNFSFGSQNGTKPFVFGSYRATCNTRQTMSPSDEIIKNERSLRGTKDSKAFELLSAKLGQRIANLGKFHGDLANQQTVHEGIKNHSASDSSLSRFGKDEKSKDKATCRSGDGADEYEKRDTLHSAIDDIREQLTKLGRFDTEKQVLKDKTDTGRLFSNGSTNGIAWEHAIRELCDQILNLAHCDNKREEETAKCSASEAHYGDFNNSSSILGAVDVLTKQIAKLNSTVIGENENEHASSRNQHCVNFTESVEELCERIKTLDKLNEERSDHNTYSTVKDRTDVVQEAFVFTACCTTAQKDSDSSHSHRSKAFVNNSAKQAESSRFYSAVNPFTARQPTVAEPFAATQPTMANPSTAGQPSSISEQQAEPSRFYTDSDSSHSHRSKAFVNNSAKQAESSRFYPAVNPFTARQPTVAEPFAATQPTMANPFTAGQPSSISEQKAESSRFYTAVNPFTARQPTVAEPFAATQSTMANPFTAGQPSSISEQQAEFSRFYPAVNPFTARQSTVAEPFAATQPTMANPFTAGQPSSISEQPSVINPFTAGQPSSISEKLFSFERLSGVNNANAGSSAEAFEFRGKGPLRERNMRRKNGRAFPNFRTCEKPDLAGSRKSAHLSSTIHSPGSPMEFSPCANKGSPPSPMVPSSETEQEFVRMPSVSKLEEVVSMYVEEIRIATSNLTVGNKQGCRYSERASGETNPFVLPQRKGTWKRAPRKGTAVFVSTEDLSTKRQSTNEPQMNYGGFDKGMARSFSPLTDLKGVSSRGGPQRHTVWNSSCGHFQNEKVENCTEFNTDEKAKDEKCPSIARGTSASLLATKCAAAEQTCEKWRLRGNQAYAKGDYEKAEDCYTRGVSSVSKGDTSESCIRSSMLCYSNRAATRMAVGRIREALADCEQAIMLDSNFLRARLRAASCHLALGESGAASVLFTECWRLAKEKSILDSKLMEEALDGVKKCQNYDSSLEKASKLLEEEPSTDALTALQLLNEALAVSPFSEATQDMKAQALFSLRRFEDVLQFCQKTLPPAEENHGAFHHDGSFQKQSVSVNLWRWRMCGKALFQLGRLDESLSLLTRYEEATCALSSDQHANTESMATTLNLIHYVLRHKAAGNEAFQAGRHTEALEHYSTALSCNSESRPYNAVCLCNRAAASQALGHIADAIADCSRAIVLDASYAKAISRRATLHEIIRDFGQTCNDLQRLINLLEKQETIASSPKITRSASKSVLELRQAQERLDKATKEMKKDCAVDHYLILGLDVSCSASDIKKAYRKAALKHHPDKQFDAAFAGGNFTESSKIRKVATFPENQCASMVDYIIESRCGTFNMGPI
ncbi:hypothetical protein L7F22_035373 [Adiantum nelumboides]|nr:hypothetical protein [Adiantum nelumboides]